MSPGTTRRGFDAEDSKWFSEKALEQMRIAQQEVQRLLDRGYKIGPVINLLAATISSPQDKELPCKEQPLPTFNMIKETPPSFQWKQPKTDV